MKFNTGDFGRLLGRRPDAIAFVKGSSQYPSVEGWVRFYETSFGCMIAAEMKGLPHHEGNCQTHFFGFHIHQNGRCSGGADETPFPDTGNHYNPDQCRHPQHAGDLPPLMEENGRAFMVVLAGSLTVQEILGRSVVLHTDPDDFHTQPAGDAGRKMACGVILPVRHS